MDALPPPDPPHGSPHDSPHGFRERLGRLCREAIVTLDIAGAAICLMSDRTTGTVVAATEDAVQLVAELEFELGEGPGMEAFDAVRPVLVPDLLERSDGRWPAYVEAATAANVNAVFVFPLHVGAALFGTLSLYDDRAFPLGPEAVPKALSLCDRAVEILMENVTLPLGHGAVRQSFTDELGRTMDLHSEVYQAQGMVMADLDVSLVESLARLRAHAFSAGLSLVAVARDVVAGRLRLPDDRIDDRTDDRTEDR